MKGVNLNYLFCRVCLGTLALTGCLICLHIGTRILIRCGTQNALTKMISADYAETNTPSLSIDWETLYPFDDASSAPETRTRFGALEEKFLAAKKKVQSYSSEKLILYYQLNELARSYEARVLHWKYIPLQGYNNVFKLRDGHLTDFKQGMDVSSAAKQAIDFARYCAEENVSFLYVQAPCKICKYQDTDISGIVDFSNQNADAFLDALNAAGVETYDFRETLHSENLEHRSLFYRTDHHWLAETGLWASSHILEYLNRHFACGTNPSPLNVEQFRKDVYPEWFLGSYGKKATLAQTTPEDISLLYPLRPTEFRFEVPSIDLDVTGDFSVFYDTEQIRQKDYYRKNPYGAYSYGDRPLKKAENYQADNHTKLLFVHDSFGDCTFPFLAMGVEKIDSIDLRHFTGSLKRYVEETKPDIVVVMYNCRAFTEQDNPSSSLLNFN